MGVSYSFSFYIIIFTILSSFSSKFFFFFWAASTLYLVKLLGPSTLQANKPTNEKLRTSYCVVEVRGECPAAPCRGCHCFCYSVALVPRVCPSGWQRGKWWTRATLPQPVRGGLFLSATMFSSKLLSAHPSSLGGHRLLVRTGIRVPWTAWAQRPFPAPSQPRSPIENHCTPFPFPWRRINSPSWKNGNGA